MSVCGSSYPCQEQGRVLLHYCLVCGKLNSPLLLCTTIKPSGWAQWSIMKKEMVVKHGESMYDDGSHMATGGGIERGQEAQKLRARKRRRGHSKESCMDVAFSSPTPHFHALPSPIKSKHPRPRSSILRYRQQHSPVTHHEAARTLLPQPWSWGAAAAESTVFVQSVCGLGIGLHENNCREAWLCVGHARSLLLLPGACVAGLEGNIRSSAGTAIKGFAAATGVTPSIPISI
ncbi:hypothetical protein BHM03_00028902 [Ensete ventricosum]|nr:hypothetical protein BHM03_00028902 [Ensete ventricosum]